MRKTMTGFLAVVFLALLMVVGTAFAKEKGEPEEKQEIAEIEEEKIEEKEEVEEWIEGKEEIEKEEFKEQEGFAEVKAGEKEEIKKKEEKKEEKEEESKENGKGEKIKEEKAEKEKKEKEEKEKKEKKEKKVKGAGFSMDGNCGAISVNGQMYYRIGLQPQFRIGKFSAGLNLNLTWNDTEGIKPWTTEDWVNLILYVQWAEKGEPPLYVRLGDLQRATLGQGFIVKRYSNMTTKAYLGAYRNIGLELDVDLGKYGFESLLGNILAPQLYGMRVFVRPLQIAGAEIPVLKHLAIGATYASDGDTGPIDTTGGNTTVADKKADIWGLDLSLPIIRRFLVFYVDYGQMVNYGNGYATGFTGGLDFTGLGLNYRFEYRNLAADFIPSYFDNYYEMGKPHYLPSAGERYNGYYGEITLDILRMVGLIITYEDSRDSKGGFKEGYPWLHGHLGLKENLFAFSGQRISLSADYDQKEARNLSSLANEKAVIEARLSYGVSANVNLVYVYTQKYTQEGRPVLTSSIRTDIHF